MLMNPAVRSSSTESSNTVAFDNVDYAAAADDGDGGNDTVVTVRVVGHDGECDYGGGDMMIIVLLVDITMEMVVIMVILVVMVIMAIMVVVVVVVMMMMH